MRGPTRSGARESSGFGWTKNNFVMHVKYHYFYLPIHLFFPRTSKFLVLPWKIFQTEIPGNGSVRDFTGDRVETKARTGKTKGGPENETSPP